MTIIGYNVYRFECFASDKLLVDSNRLNLTYTGYPKLLFTEKDAFYRKNLCQIAPAK